MLLECDSYMKHKKILDTSQTSIKIHDTTCCREHLEKTNCTFNDNDTITYIPRRKMKFVLDLSVGDPEKDRIVVPNIPLLVMSLMRKYSKIIDCHAEAYNSRLVTSVFVIFKCPRTWNYVDFKFRFHRIVTNYNISSVFNARS